MTTLWIENVIFLTASPEEVAGGVLGWVTCQVGGSLRLDPMRVRLLHDGTVRIKVRRGGVDRARGAVSLDDETRQRIHDLIEEDEVFLAALDGLGLARTEPAP